MDIESHSFILRIWNDSIGARESVWRGSIEEVGSDRKFYFSHFEDVVHFIQEQIGVKPPGKIKFWKAFIRRIKDAVNKS